MYPQRFEELVSLLEKLPGVGNKTAQRYAFTLLDKPQEDIELAIEALQGLKDIKRCKICGFLSDGDECAFCKDKSRNKTTIMVVAYPQDAVAIEKTGSYKGSYHVLNGLISSSKGIYPEDINIDKLLSRIDGTIKEVIVATSPTMDGEMTALYLDKVLREKKSACCVWRKAQVLPLFMRCQILLLVFTL